jgi:hypothetical protein
LQGSRPIKIVLALGAVLAVVQPAAAGRPGGGSLDGYETGRRAELVPTVPVASRAGDATRSVLSLKLPRLERGDTVRFNGEVTITTTCVEQISRCIGDSYRYDPRLRARIVIASDRADANRGNTVDVSRTVGLTCEQTRPNRNHHCPLVVEGGSFTVRELRDLPCPADGCRLNMLVDAFEKGARANQVVVVGADQEDGSVEGGKARLSAAVSHGRIEIEERRTTNIRDATLPASFSGGKTVVYSQRLGRLARGDVLLVRSAQRTAIRRLPYFISNQIVIGTRPTATGPSRLTRRVVSRSGLATETTGFNCTIGASAFSSPCRGIKAGLVTIERNPVDKRGRRVALYVNVVSRGFPKLAQARASFPPARVRRGGALTVRRLRLSPGR